MNYAGNYDITLEEALKIATNTEDETIRESFEWAYTDLTGKPCPMD